jgi:hypothetical protein
LDFEFKNAIPPHGTITGFWLWDSKVKCDIPIGSKIQYRIALSTFSGIKFERTTPEITIRKEGQANFSIGRTSGPEFHVVGPPTDISKFFVIPWWNSPIQIEEKSP